jgi:hypothetical protein
MEQAAQLNYVAADDDTAANCFQLNPHYQHHNDTRERERSKRMYSPGKDSFILKTSCNKYHILRNLKIDAKNLNINLMIYVEVGGWMLCLIIKHRKEGRQLAE